MNNLLTWSDVDRTSAVRSLGVDVAFVEGSDVGTVDAPEDLLQKHNSLTVKVLTRFHNEAGIYFTIILRDCTEY